MAQRPTAKDLKTKQLTEAAAAYLRQQEKGEWADAIDYAMSPAGQAMLDRLYGEGMDKNFAVEVDAKFAEHVRKRVAEIAEADPEQDVATVTDAANKALRLFLSGEFRPSEYKRAARGSAGQKLMLNVRLKGALRKQVEERLRDPEVLADLGFKPSLGALVRNYLERVYPMPEDALSRRKAASKARSLPRGSQRLPMVPREIRTQIRESAAALNEAVEDIVDEGMQKFLDGKFDAMATVWSEQQRQDMVPLSMYPNDDLYGRVKEKAAQIGLRPSQLAVDYLLDEFGIDAGTD